MKAKKIIYQIILITLMALWIPISLDKFMNYELFKSAMIQQPFSDQLGEFLAYSLPALELAVGLLFILPKTRLWAFRLSSLLMAAFVAYVGLAVLKVWGKFPCGCGLVFHQIGWIAHLWLNIGFLLISLLGLSLELYFYKNQTPKNKIAKNSANTAVSARQSAAKIEVPAEPKPSPRLQREQCTRSTAELGFKADPNEGRVCQKTLRVFQRCCRWLRTENRRIEGIKEI